MKKFNRFIYEYNGEQLVVSGVGITKDSKNSKDCLIDCICERFGEFEESKLKFINSESMDLTDEMIEAIKKETAFQLYNLIEKNKEKINFYEEKEQDYEKKDMNKYFKEYSELKIIPYETMLNLQRYYNSEVLSSSWVGCTSPYNLIKFLSNIKEK